MLLNTPRRDELPRNLLGRAAGRTVTVDGDETAYAPICGSECQGAGISLLRIERRRTKAHGDVKSDFWRNELPCPSGGRMYTPAVYAVPRLWAPVSSGYRRPQPGRTVTADDDETTCTPIYGAKCQGTGGGGFCHRPKDGAHEQIRPATGMLPGLSS